MKTTLKRLRKMTDETASPEQSRVAADCPNERLVMCDCYPEHCVHGDTCWCEPELEIIDGNKLIIHREVN